MEINFKNPTFSDKPIVDKLLFESEKRFCEYTFGNIICWGAKYDISLAITEKGFITGSPKRAYFSFPIGEDKDEIIRELINKYPEFSLSSLSEKEAEYLKDNFDNFEITPAPARFDYIYLSEKLSTLSGKKLASKRNHINAFLSSGKWHTEILEAKHIPLLYEFNKEWCMGLCDEKDSSLAAEMCAVNTGLENYQALGFCGLVLYKDGKIAGYSYGEPINKDTFCVHVEKADINIRGAYQMINREFVRTYCQDYTYVNREDDAGDEGLRKAKLSYYPTNVGSKWKAVYKK